MSERGGPGKPNTRISGISAHQAWPERSGPKILDRGLSEILVPFQAAKHSAAWVKYTTSGVLRSSAL